MNYANMRRRPLSAIVSHTLIHQAHPGKSICRRCGHDVRVVLRCVATGMLHPADSLRGGPTLERISDRARRTQVTMSDELDRCESGARQQLYDMEQHEFSAISVRFFSYSSTTIGAFIARRDPRHPLDGCTSGVLSFSESSRAVGSHELTSRVGHARFRFLAHLLRPSELHVNDAYNFGGVRTIKTAAAPHPDPTMSPSSPSPRIAERLLELGLPLDSIAARYPVVAEYPTIPPPKARSSRALIAERDSELVAIHSVMASESNEREGIHMQSNECFMRIVIQSRSSLLRHSESFCRNALQEEALYILSSLRDYYRAGIAILEEIARVVAAEASRRRRIQLEESLFTRQLLMDQCLSQVEDMLVAEIELKDPPERPVGPERLDAERIRMGRRICTSLLDR